MTIGKSGKGKKGSFASLNEILFVCSIFLSRKSDSGAKFWRILIRLGVAHFQVIRLLLT